jgi:putative ABC transport system permease protein
MLLHHIKIAIRNLIRNKSYSVASVLGLTVGLSACLIVAFFALNEWSYDQYHTQKDRIYRLATNVKGSTYGSIAKVSGPWGISAKEEIPEVENMARFVMADKAVFDKGGEKYYETEGKYADSTVFQIFSYNLLEGDVYGALSKPNSIVLTQSLKEKYFKDESAVGQSLKLNGEDFVVTGVMNDVPANSHFDFNYLLSMSSLRNPEMQDWVRWNQFYTYLLLKEGASPELVATKMKSIVAGHMDAENVDLYTPFLQPIMDIHLHSHLFREMTNNSDIIYTYALSSIAILILLISCANFFNLAVAQATKLAKEVGIRKVTGSDRKQLIGRFLAEAFIISAVSAWLANVVATFGFPLINQLTGKSLALDYWHYPIALYCLVGLVLVIAVLGGGYAAFYLSSLKPVEAIKGKLIIAGNNYLRQGLVVFQFALSSLLVIATVVIQQQIYFVNNRPLGFDPEQIVTIPIQADYLKTNVATVKNELLSIPGVRTVSASGNQPGGSDWGIPSLAEGFTDDNMPPLRVMAIDAHFLDAFGIKVATGRGFDGEHASDSTAYLINEEAARQLGWNSPLEKTMSMPPLQRPAGPVVGVVHDFHFRSMKEKIGGLLFFMPPPSWYSQYSIKIDGSKMNEVLKAIEKKWSSYDPEHPFTYSFFDEDYGKLYEQEKSLAGVVNLFALVSVFLACLGLFSLVSLSTEQRFKEIGIRKVSGATTPQIVFMFSSEYVKLVLVGFVLALPVGLWCVTLWLQTFAYRVDLNFWTISVTCIVSIVLALLTISYKVMSAARANPVQSLRSE